MLSIEFYKRQASQLEIFVKPSEETASLRAGALATLPSGDEATFVGSREFPSGKFAWLVAGPSVKLNRTATLAIGDAERSDVFVRLAEDAGPKGNAAILLRAPLGALTDGGKVLRALDAAKGEQDASKRLGLAKEAMRLAYLWGKRAAPFPAPALADVKAQETEKPPPKLEPTTNYDPSPGSPWGLGALVAIAGLVVGGYILSSGGGEEEEED